MRYYPPYLRGQQGEGLTEDMIQIGAPVVLESVRTGQEAAEQGALWQAARQALKRGLKRERWAMVKPKWTVGDIFGKR